MKLRIALATSAEQADLHADDRILADALRDFADVYPLIWTDEWPPQAHDVCIIRSTWDSHLHPQRYLDWIRAQSAQTRLFNSAHLIEWNFHKSYLLELAARGVPVIPTLLYRRGGAIDIRQRLQELQCNEVVVKPAISASAYQTRRFDTRNVEDIERFAGEVLQERDVLVQPLRPEVFTTREHSAVYIGGEFSHAARRLPFGEVTPFRQAGDPDVPFSEAERRFCELVVRSLPASPLYARIDYIVDAEAGPLLMEVELIDPRLFFQYRPESATDFAAALKRAVRTGEF